MNRGGNRFAQGIQNGGRLRAVVIPALAIGVLVAGVSPPAVDAPTLSDAGTFASDDPSGSKGLPPPHVTNRPHVSVAERIPTYAGSYVDEAAKEIFVLVTDSRRQSAERARAAIVDLGGDRAMYAAWRLNVLPAKYNYLELTSWHEQLRPMLARDGVTSLGLDEPNNRLFIGVENVDRHREQVETEVLSLGVPIDAFVIEEAAGVELALRNHHRPLRGGLQIRWGWLGLGGPCSIGVIATRQGINGFTTAAHCSGTWGQVNNTEFYQPTYGWLGANRVGHETVNRAFFTGGPCPQGRRCQIADTLFATRGGTPALRGRIAMPPLNVSRNEETRPWNGQSELRLTGKHSPTEIGRITGKSGRTTGWTRGPLHRYCWDTNVNSTDITLLCQHVVDAYARPGDSGAPVFWITNSPSTNDATLAGTLWGTTEDFDNRVMFVFSDIQWIQDQLRGLGTIQVCAAGFAC